MTIQTLNKISKSLVSLIMITLAMVFAINETTLADQFRVTTTPGELNRCVMGLPLTTGPDTGSAAGAGDECVLDTGVHTLIAPAMVMFPNMTVMATSSATTVVGPPANAAFLILQPNVTLGGDDDEGFTITGGHGVAITDNATRDIKLENLLITSTGFGIIALNLLNLETLEVIDSELRNNPNGGLVIADTVGYVDDLRVVGNQFDGNGGNNIHLANTGNLSDVSIVDNNIRFAPMNGIYVENTVTNVSDFAIEQNSIQGNGNGGGGHGVWFTNNGQTEVLINNNKDGRDGGISGNGCHGVMFSGSNTNVEAEITSNNFNNNGRGVFCPAIGFYNSGDVDDLEFKYNTVKQNGSDGLRIRNGTDVSDAEIMDNRFENNGVSGFGPSSNFGNGVFILAGDDVENVLFENNRSTENFNRGVLLASADGDITNILFKNEHYEQNGLSIPTNMGFMASGLELSSFGGTSNIEIRDSVSSRNGGAGVFVDANGNALVNMEQTGSANPSDLGVLSMYNNEFNYNGNSAPTGAGVGVFLLGENVDKVTSQDNTMSFNDDHGLFINSLDDTDDINVNGDTYNNNDFNIDGVGSGVQLEATNDLRDVVITNVEARDNNDGIHLNIKGQNGINIDVINSLSCNNDGSGIRIDANDDVQDVVITGNGLDGNDPNVDIQVTDQGSVQQTNNNLGDCELPTSGPAPTSVAVPSASAPVTLSVTPLGHGAFEFRALNAHNLSVMHLDIISTSGERMYSTSSSTGTVLAHGLSNNGQPLSNGVYFYAVTLVKTDGTIERIIKKVMILR